MIRLSDHIAAAGGWLSLEAFMQLALHHPEEGYYSTAIENIGMRGDFSTTPTLSPILAKAIIARWKEACARCGTRLPLLEIGAGSGALAVKIMDQLGFWNRLNTDYVIVEASPRLREFQHLLLGSQAKIYSGMEKALKHCGGKAFIFSNELVDAFPARVFEYTEQGWQEVGLTGRNCVPSFRSPCFPTCWSTIPSRASVLKSMIPTPSGSPHGFPCGVRAP